MDNRELINKVWSAALLKHKGSNTGEKNYDNLIKEYPDQSEYINRLFNKHLGILKVYSNLF